MPSRLRAKNAAVLDKLLHRRVGPVTGANQRPRSNTGSLPPLPPGVRAPSGPETSAATPIVAAAPVVAAAAAAAPDPAVAAVDDEGIPELTDVDADDSAPHRAPSLSPLHPPSVIVDSSIEDPSSDEVPVGRLAKLTRLDQARLSAAIDAALDDDEPKA